MDRKPLPLWQDGLPQCHGHVCPHWLEVESTISEVFVPHSWWSRFLLKIVRWGSMWSRKQILRPGGACVLTRTMVEGLCEPTITELVRTARAVCLLQSDDPLPWYNVTGTRKRDIEVVEKIANEALHNYFI